MEHVENQTKYRRINQERPVYQCGECMHLAEFEADGPFENMWDFCPYCGRRIVGQEDVPM